MSLATDTGLPKPCQHETRPEQQKDMSIISESFIGGWQPSQYGRNVLPYLQSVILSKVNVTHLSESFCFLPTFSYSHQGHLLTETRGHMAYHHIGHCALLLGQKKLKRFPRKPASEVPVKSRTSYPGKSPSSHHGTPCDSTVSMSHLATQIHFQNQRSHFHLQNPAFLPAHYFYQTKLSHACAYTHSCFLNMSTYFND